MASAYEVATEDVCSLVASTLDVATQQDRTFVAGASQALADWTAKYQHGMSQGKNQSMHDQLAHWDQVQEARIALSRQITTLSTEHEQSTVSGKIFQTLILACFQCIWVRTEDTFSELNATLPSLLCRFVAPDQAGQIMASIFTCLCNYNTEICGMAMAQTVVPVYTIPNTYQVQQSLLESLCQIIPGIPYTSGSELHSFEPAAPCKYSSRAVRYSAWRWKLHLSRNWDCWIGEPAKCSSFIVHLQEGCYPGNTPRWPSGQNPSSQFQMGLVPTICTNCQSC